MKKILTICFSLTMLTMMLAGCGGTTTPKEEAAFDTTKGIVVVSREPGSGTRGAFVELLGIEVKDEAGNKKDMTTDKAIISNQTEAVITQVSGNPYAIGYISLGSLNNNVKALKVNGVEPKIDNIKSGSYKVARPFMIVTKGEAIDLKKDFIDFALSKEGQAVVTANKYIVSVDNAAPYSGSKPSGKIVVGGSSSVSPLMEKLIEAYKQVNPNATVELQSTDSTAGVKNATAGSYDIGMASREIKEAEKPGLVEYVLALDGIAVIANNANSISDIASADVTKVFKGEATKWSEVIK